MILSHRGKRDELLDHATERCLIHIGLEKSHAAKGIRELRDLLKAWRDARHAVWQTTFKGNGL